MESAQRTKVKHLVQQSMREKYALRVFAKFVKFNFFIKCVLLSVCVWPGNGF